MSFNHESPVRDLQVSSATGVENDKQLRSACYKEFKEAYAQAQELLLRDLPAIPLWYPNVVGGYSEAVDNVSVNWKAIPVYWAITKQ